jgi:hypothetical protein
MPKQPKLMPSPPVNAASTDNNVPAVQGLSLSTPVGYGGGIGVLGESGSGVGVQGTSESQVG